MKPIFKGYPQIKKGDVWKDTSFYKWLQVKKQYNQTFDEAFKSYLFFYSGTLRELNIDKYQREAHRACYEVYKYENEIEQGSSGNTD